MTSSATACSTGDGSVAAYEELRRHVLAGSRSDGHTGVLWLIREGIAAWMTRCSSRAVPHTPAVDSAPRAANAPAVFDEIHAGLVRGLASMALASRREMGL